MSDTATEAALKALAAALLAKSQEVDSPLPAPLRNEALPAAMTAAAADLATYLNQWDGAGEPADEMLGADHGIPACYAIEHRAVLEWMVAGGDAADREAKFDAGLRAIRDAIRPALSGDTLTFLGGAVSHTKIERIARAGSGLVTDGLPNIKSAEVTVLLVFTSDDPF